MKKHIIYITFTLASFISLSCSHFDDMNKSSYNLYDTNAESFVQPILYNTERTILSSNYSLLSEIMQYTVNGNYETSAQLAYNYVISEALTANIWRIYTQFGNAQYMLATARKENNPAMVGVALVLRSLIGQILTDTYGNVPYTKAGNIALQGNEFDYTTEYDEQNKIYIDLIRSLEEANECFNKAKELVSMGMMNTADFNPLCDFMYNGEIDKWQRFGNALYLRVLMRISLKVIEESDGIISLGEDYGDINIISKINDLYECYLSGNGVYPIMRGIEDSARVGFSYTDSALYTPFYSTTSGSWQSELACNTLIELMNINYVKNNDDASTFDPRLFRYFYRWNGLPTQLLREDMRNAIDTTPYVGYYTRGQVGYNHTGNLKNGSSYALLNFDEILFNFAEAGARGWIVMGQNTAKSLYIEANLKSIMQWQVGWETAVDYYREDSPVVERFINYLDNEYDYNRSVEFILRQKYVATFWVGVESWADYRRTGYPILKTNGPAAANNGILPTRMRYPATEAYQNKKWYTEALNGWLDGENNMQTDLWWASTSESQSIRKLGRK